MDDKILRYWAEKYKPEQIFVGYSGGLDSSFLLFLCSQLNVNVTAIHVNHHLHPLSNQWEKYCQNQAELLGVNFRNIRLTPPSKLRNLEHWARIQRYTFFNYIISKYCNSLLFTAHHQEDQAETFLLNAIRGSGISGLSGISKEHKIKNGYLIRPFLDIPRSVIKDYCIQYKVTWLEDPSNKDTKFKRNAIRYEILQKLQGHFSGISKGLTKSARWCQETKKLLELYLQQDLQKCISADGNTIKIDQLFHMETWQKKHLIKYWLKNYFNINVNSSQLYQIIRGVEQRQSNWQYHVLSLQLSIYYNQLRVQLITSNKQIEITLTKVIKWLDNYPLNFLLNFCNIRIRSRQPSDYCRYPGRLHRQKLKVIYQELKITVPKRNELKVIYNKKKPNDIIGIYPLFVCPEYLKNVVI